MSYQTAQNQQPLSGMRFFALPQSLVASGATVYGMLSGNSTFNATEANRIAIAPFGGTMSRLYVSTSTAQPGTGALTIGIRINGATQAGLSITISAGSGAGNFSNTSDTLSIPEGSAINFIIINGASSNSASIFRTSLFLL